MSQRTISTDQIYLCDKSLHADGIKQIIFSNHMIRYSSLSFDVIGRLHNYIEHINLLVGQQPIQFCNIKLIISDLRVQLALWFSCSVLKNPAQQGQISAASELVSVLAGHCKHELAGSDCERQVPLGQAVCKVTYQH